MRFHELFEYHRKNSAKKWKTALAEISPTTDPEETLKEIEKAIPPMIKHICNGLSHI